MDDLVSSSPSVSPSVSPPPPTSSSSSSSLRWEVDGRFGHVLVRSPMMDSKFPAATDSSCSCNFFRLVFPAGSHQPHNRNLEILGSAYYPRVSVRVREKKSHASLRIRRRVRISRASLKEGWGKPVRPLHFMSQ